MPFSLDKDTAVTALWQGVSALKDPAPSSWVARVAFTFRIMSYAAISPIIVLTLLVSMGLLAIPLEASAVCAELCCLDRTLLRI